MAITNFNTENSEFRKLMGNGVSYRIPPFQRDYSWTEEQWEELWQDILESLASDAPASHYMGYLVLQSSKARIFNVIDGQQRLTTISLIVLAALKNIQNLVLNEQQAEDNQQRMTQIRQSYIGYLDPVTLTSRAKLTLNRNNNSYFQNHIIPLDKALPNRGLPPSTRLLRKAFEWFDNKIAEFIKTEDESHGEILAQLVEDICDCLFFTVITITDELNAYRVFETLNAHGVQLSTTDLLKNYLFSIIDTEGDDAHELDNLQERWEDMLKRLHADTDLPEFLRTHWNSRNKFARKAELFKIIRKNIATRGAAFELLRNMAADIDPWLALTSPEGSDWSQEDKQYVRTLQLLQVKQPFALLIAARRVFNDRDFSGLLRAIVVISLRYNLIGSRSPNEQERIYNQAAQQIILGDSKDLITTLKTLKTIYIPDKIFHAYFSEKTIKTSRSTKIAGFILCAIEKHISGQAYDFNDASLNIEHILPQKAPDDWGNFSNEEAANMKDRLGNMTLLQKSYNNSLGNKKYQERRTTYSRSGFQITRNITENHDEWTALAIARRQQWMAEQAVAIWRISQFD